MVKRTKRAGTVKEARIEGTRKKRKSLINETKDKILNVKRATENAGGKCVICGKEIRKNQSFRELPKDKNCQEVRLYHVRTCGPGSDNWKIFKANGKKAPVELPLKGQLSFTWIKAKGNRLR